MSCHASRLYYERGIEPMGEIYGPHTAEVIEVVEFLRSGRLLRPQREPQTDPSDPSDPSIHTIHTLDGVAQYREPPPDLGEDEEPPFVWLDILKLEEPAYYSE